VARFQEQFIGMVGHDLRNPLAAIAMSTAGLTRHVAPELRGMLERIGASAEWMGRMIDQLLDLTRARLVGGIPIQRAPADLGDIVGAAVDELRAAHAGRELRLHTSGAVDGNWDADRLAQVVSNLVGNAVEHGDAARPVEVTVEGHGDTVTLIVHNEGPPITDELMPVLFEPYRRGAQSADTASGIGLGLYITQQIIHAHQGRIQVQSSLAGGTTFRVELPRGSSGRQEPGDGNAAAG
jgi:signal transduction histidine kinase